MVMQDSRVESGVVQGSGDEKGHHGLEELGNKGTKGWEETGCCVEERGQVSY